ncbi:MAG: HEPN domain-containing protein [Candidatus Aenigmatarchaeota archaeon]
MEEIKEWLEKAEKDFFRAEFCLANKDFEDYAFHAHQAVENALKALYIKKFKRLWKTHDLVGLGSKLRIDKNLLKLCDELNRHYIETRYPTGAEYTSEVAERAIKNSKKLLE